METAMEANLKDKPVRQAPPAAATELADPPPAQTDKAAALPANLTMDKPVRQATPAPAMEPSDPPSMQTDNAVALPAHLKIIAPVARQDRDQTALVRQSLSIQKRHSAREALLGLSRKLATLVVALAAVLISLVAWDHYLTAPWTRDGRVR